MGSERRSRIGHWLPPLTNKSGNSSEPTIYHTRIHHPRDLATSTPGLPPILWLGTLLTHATRACETTSLHLSLSLSLPTSLEGGRDCEMPQNRPFAPSRLFTPRRENLTLHGQAKERNLGARHRTYITMPARARCSISARAILFRGFV